MSRTSPERVDNLANAKYDSDMNEPRFVLSPGTKIKTHDYLGGTGGLLIKDKHLEARKTKAPGVIRGFVAGHGGDVYWVQHDEEEVAAAYGFREFELTDPADIEKHRTSMEIATAALLSIVNAHTPNDMVFTAAKALAKIGVPLPEETPPAVVEFYEAEKK